MEKQRAKAMELAVRPVRSSLLCPAARVSEVGAQSLQASRGGCFLCFADKAPILCSESMCYKDKPQENSCCLLTLTIRAIGKWRKQEMTNGFSDQEEMVAV